MLRVVFYNVFQLPKRTPPPPPLCRLARPAGWGFEYMLQYISVHSIVCNLWLYTVIVDTKE
jgi:hypothetical protein